MEYKTCNSKLFKSIAEGKMPGDVLEVTEVSHSTLRRWEKAKWISDRSASGNRFGVVCLRLTGHLVS